MAKPNGRYRKLEAMQNLGAVQGQEDAAEVNLNVVEGDEKQDGESLGRKDEETEEMKKEEERQLSRRAWLLGLADTNCEYIAIACSVFPFFSCCFF